jgi:ABC-type antimicrobial peptide transport system permease subunit
MGIPLIAGEDFRGEAPLECGGTAPPSLPQPCPAQSESSNAPAKPQVKDAVVNQAFAQILFPQQDSINRHVSGGGVTYRIIGVAKNTKSRTLGESQSAVLYRSLEQTAGTEASMMGYALVVRTAGDPSSLARSVREQVSALDPNIAVFNAETMQQHLHDALFLPRFAGTMFAIFGSVGLILAAVGLFGVMSYSVSRRTHEIGIRMAVGAAPYSVQSLIVRQGLLLTAIGGTAGLAAALVVSKFAATLLYGVHPRDAITFTTVPLFLTAVSLAATYLPARRAAKVDPLTALRHD